MTKIQFRKGSYSDWASQNPVLAQGEMVVETDTMRFKLGDGTTNYNDLNYVSFDGGSLDGESLTGLNAQSCKNPLVYCEQLGGYFAADPNNNCGCPTITSSSSSGCTWCDEHKPGCLYQNHAGYEYGRLVSTWWKICPREGGQPSGWWDYRIDKNLVQPGYMVCEARWVYHHCLTQNSSAIYCPKAWNIASAEHWSWRSWTCDYEQKIYYGNYAFNGDFNDFCLSLCGSSSSSSGSSSSSVGISSSSTLGTTMPPV